MEHDPDCASITKLLLTHPPQVPQCDCSLSRVASYADPYGRKPVAPLPLHVQRMSEETKQVVQRLVALDRYITGSGTGWADQSMLKRQLMAEQKAEMISYAKSLSLRYFMELLAHEE